VTISIVVPTPPGRVLIELLATLMSMDAKTVTNEELRAALNSALAEIDA
jgi:hypothetical protein